MRHLQPIVIGKLFDKEPPSDLAAEASLLGCMILDPSVIDEAAELVRSEDFYDADHRAIHDGIRTVYAKAGTLDLVMLQNHLRTTGVYDQIGGDARVVQIASDVPAATNAVFYARQVADKARLRRMADVIGRGLHAIYTGTDAADVIDAIEAGVLQAAKANDATEDATLTDVTNEITARWEAGFADDDELLYPWTDLNEKLGGLRKGELTIVAARPSQGKTAWGLQTAFHVARKVPTTFYSLEMKRDSLILRELCSALQRSWRDTYRGNVDMARAAHEIGRMNENQLRVHDRVARKWESIQSAMRRSVSKFGTRVFVVDYIQLIRTTQKFDRRDQELAFIANDMQQTAKALNVSIVTLAQINRGGTQREGSRPMLSDIKESGGIEEAADIAVLLHRPEYYHLHELEAWRANNPDDVGVAEMIVAKHRNGPVGVVRTKWVEKAMRFEDLRENHSW